MSENPLQQSLSVIAADPHSVAALTLYSLISTLEYAQAGYLFKLIKLCDLDEDKRQIAYGLMEMMAQGKSTGTEWQTVKQQMDELIRQG